MKTANTMNTRRASVAAMAVCTIALALGCKSEQSVVELPDPPLASQPLEYAFTAEDANGVKIRSTMGRERLFNCAKSYCAATHPRHRYVETSMMAPLDDPFVTYRTNLCMSDLFMEIVNGTFGVTLKEEPDWLAATGLDPRQFDFHLAYSCGQGSPGSVSDLGASDVLTFDPLQSVDQREEIREMAFRQYYNATSNLLTIIDDPYERSRIYSQLKDTWFFAKDPDRSTGVALAEQAYNTLPTIVDAMQRIKFANAEERSREGVLKGDEWRSPRHGRRPALQHLFGNVGCGPDEVELEIVVAGVEQKICWRRCPLGQEWRDGECKGNSVSMSLKDADSACQGWGDGYRLATVGEFMVLLGPCNGDSCTACAGSPTCFGLFPGDAGTYWAESTSAKSVSLETGSISTAAPDNELDVRCVRALDGEGSVPSVTLLPDGNAPVPRMTAALRRTIQLLDEYGLDFVSYGNGDLDPAGLPKALLDLVNKQRWDMGLIGYTSFQQLATERKITVADLEDAVRYMYSHLLAFPRLSKKSGGGVSDDARASVGLWQSPHVEVPLAFTIKDFQTSFFDGFEAFPEISDGGRLARAGLVPTLQTLRKSIAVVLGALGGTPVPGYADSDDVAFDNAVATNLAIGEAIGDRWMQYTIDDDGFVLLDLFNPRYEFVDEIIPDLVDKVRIYQIGETEGIGQFETMACLHTYWDLLEANPDEIPDLKCDPRDNGLEELVEPTCVWQPESGVPRCSFKSVWLGEHKFWMVEILSSTDPLDKSWRPVGVIVNDDPDGKGPIELIIEGIAVAAGNKVTSHKYEDMTLADCDSISNLTGKCMDRDWVPAIDNELIDTSGNQYEQSYRHYLNLARIAADKARDLREQLVSDIINEAHDEAVEEAQFQSALDDYMAGIREICGEQTSEEFANVAASASDLHGSEFSTFLESILASPYGCDYSTNNGNPNPNLAIAAKQGPVHCAEIRNCGPGVSLSDLGIQYWDDVDAWTMDMFPDWTAEGFQLMFEGVNVSQGGSPSTTASSSSYTSTTLSGSNQPEMHPGAQNLVNPNDVCSQYHFSFDELVSGEGVISPFHVESLADRFTLMKHLVRLRCWAGKYRQLATGILMGQTLTDLPNMYLTHSPSVLGEKNDFFGAEITSELQESYGYGRYSDAMQEIAVDMDELRSAAASYVTEFNHAIAVIDAIRASIQASNLQSYLNLGSSLASAVAQETMYQAGFEDATMQCLAAVHLNYSSGDMKYENVFQAIKALSGNFHKVKNSKWKNMNERSEFQLICEDTAMSSDSSFLASNATRFCSTFADHHWWKVGNKDTWSQEEMFYSCGNGACDFLPFLYHNPPWFMARCTDSQPGCNFDGWEVVGNKGEAYCNADDCEGCSMDVLCEDKMWFKINPNSIGAIARQIFEEWLANDYTQCESRGCEVTEDGKIVPGSCQGAASDFLASNTGKWEPGGSLFSLGMQAQNLQSEAQYANLVDQIILVGRNLETAKYDISNLLRGIAMNIGELSRLEQEQVQEFRSFVNKKGAAEASSYANLAEWQERYNFRRAEYHRLLQRARIAAWTARRAVEFRFGIDLSRETTATIYGDIPAKWADDIYGTDVSYCGLSSSEIADLVEGDTEGDIQGNGVAQCYTQEDLIERYVEKLEDYVASYGNNPNDYWWFHEDDDTGVISMRDHLAVTGLDCNPTVQNLLFFTEELERSDLAGYEEVAGLVPVEPATWVASGASVQPGAEGLGSPTDVVLSHFNNEYGLFADQMDHETADLVTFNLSPPGSLEQVTPREDMSTSPDFDFSVFLRAAPFQAEEDCEPGEQFFPSIGRCGVPCDISTDAPAPWGTCPAGFPGGDRRVCMAAGIGEDAYGEITQLYMCQWCSADRGCQYENGYPLLLSTQICRANDASITGWETIIASRTVNAYPYWTRARVNTVEDIETSLVSSGYSEDLQTEISGKVAQNLVTSSERWDSGWSTGAASLAADEYLAPDGTGSCPTLIMGSETTIAVSVGEQDPGAYTGSVWLRVQDSLTELPNVRLTLNSEGTDVSSEDVLGAELLTLTPGWRRYQVAGSFQGTISDLALVVQRLDEGGDPVPWPAGTILGVWGAQIEEGLGASPYLPTGKNLLSASSGFDTWDPNTVNGADAVVVDVAGPDGRKGEVYALTDDDPTRTQLRRRETGVLPAGTYTFSLWMRTMGGQQPARIRIHSAAGGGNAWLDVGPIWNRYHVTATTTSDVSLEARIFPADEQAITDHSETGTVLVWGAQIEAGNRPTGYQTRGVIASTASVGLVGAQLNRVGSIPCDIYGRPTTTYESCFEMYKGMRSDCCAWDGNWNEVDYPDFYDFYEHCTTCLSPGDCGHKAELCHPDFYCGAISEDTPQTCVAALEPYRRNTYLRQHVSDACDLENAGGADLPLPEDLVPYISKSMRQALFKNQFERVPAAKDRPAYWAYRFKLDMDAIEAGVMGQFGVLAQGNFNYRLRTVALNIVGTDVLDCSQATSPSTCAANPWVSYDLKQMGDVFVRNHHMEFNVRPFKIPTGRISGGKAWAAEQVIGFPTSGAHQGALSQIQKVSLMGRPLEGSYELRIYDTPELVWPNVEDIQFVLGYHYWTRSE